VGKRKGMRKGRRKNRVKMVNVVNRLWGPATAIMGGRR
jgi:hypothetical protein